jgi:hypothetical protein
MRICENCGWPLHHFDGEPFCPDCTSYTLAALPDDDEPPDPGPVLFAGPARDDGTPV